MTVPLFSARDVRKHYGPVEVLRGVDLDVGAGEAVALLGENGAGKSTLSNIIAGSIRASAGRMELRGRPYDPANPRAAIDAGVALIHQELRLLPHLSIAENVFVGRWPARAGRVDRQAMVERAAAQLARLGLDMPVTATVGGLSTAAQQLVEIARALELDARLLILDEPTAALGGPETQRLFRQIDQLKSDGVGIVYISHRLEEVRRIADRIVVLRDGAVVATFERGDVPVRTLVESMVGRSVDRLFPPLPEPSEEIGLDVAQLSAPDGRFSDVTFQVRRGEIVGVAGLVGAGRTELIRAIAGADPIGSGTVRVGGELIAPARPADALRRGIVLVPEDRKTQGLVVDHPVAENVGYANLAAVSSRGIVSRRRLNDYVQTGVARVALRGDLDQPVAELSGGNQQKVVLAKWLARAPTVVLLDEPTRGVDVGSRAAIYEIIVSLAEQGACVVVVSSDLDEVLGLSNRVLVMARGRQTGILNRDQATDVAVMELATR